MKFLLRTLIIVAGVAMMTVPLSADPEELGGTYWVKGTMPSGDDYSGTCSIVKSGSVYNFKWKVGNTVTTGSGKLSGMTLTVDVPAQNDDTAYKVVYKVKDAGRRLEGNWGDKMDGTEVLSKY